MNKYPRQHIYISSLLLTTLASLITNNTIASTLNIELGTEFQYFSQDQNDANSNFDNDTTSYFRLKYDSTYYNGTLKLLVDGTATYDQRDEHRRRGDFNQLALSYLADDIDITAGMLTEFWGVAESRHLVDIINQTNVADNIDEESKLGQAMIKAQYHHRLGNIQLYLMPQFRERIFTSNGARLHPGLPIDDELTQYESSAEKNHRDIALRYSNTVGAWDIGIAHFHGTSREALLQPKFISNSQVVLAPFYEQIDQSSIDMQMTSDSLLLKLEAINHNSALQNNYFAAVTGFEYTQVGIMNSAMDLGYMAEYLYDERDTKANTPFADDIFVGLRLAANNIAQTNYFIGTYIDRITHSHATRLEIKTRLRDGLTLTLEGQTFNNQPQDDLLYNYRNDDYLKVGIQIFF